jgi:drug/metabolite transporter (DMT)-like permease
VSPPVPAAAPAAPDPALVRRGTLAVLAASVLWSSGGVFIKLAPLPPLAVACGRAFVTTAFFLLAYRPDLRRARVTTAANAVFLQYTGLAWVLPLAPFVLGERFRPIDAACVLASLGGVALLLLGGGAADGGSRLGDLVAVASGFFFTFTLLFLRRDARPAAAGARGADVQASTTLGNLIAAAVTLPFAASDLAGITPRGALVLLYLGTIQVGLAYGIFNRGLKHLPAARAGLVAMLEPVMNPLWVLLGTGERPSAWTIAGGAIVIGAVGARTALDRGGTART